MRTLIVSLLSALGAAEEPPTVQGAPPVASAPSDSAPAEPVAGAAAPTTDAQTPELEPEPEPQPESESGPEPETETEPKPAADVPAAADTPARNLTTITRGSGIYQWAAGARFDADFRWRGGISIYGEGQRDFIGTEVVDPGQTVARGGAAIRLGHATFGFKANYFFDHQPFKEQLVNRTLVDIVGKYDLPLHKLDLKLKAFGGINAEWADQWNGLAFGGARRALTLDELSPKAPDIGTLNLLTIATGPAGGPKYKPSVLALAIYDMPRGLPFGLSGFYTFYGYHSRVGDSAPWGRVGFSKAYEVTGFKKGVWTKHVVGIGWAQPIAKAQRGRLSELYVGVQYIWGLDDGFKGREGSPRDAIPTGYDGGAGDLAFLLWWIELKFDVRRQPGGDAR